MILTCGSIRTLQNMKKRIKAPAVMTGGGDCPGLNAIIRAVVKTLINAFEVERVLKIQDSYEGMYDGRISPISFDNVSEILFQGGTIIGTSNEFNPFAVPLDKKATKTRDVSNVCIANLRSCGVDGLIIIGGDGTMSIASLLSKKLERKGFNIPIIGIPKTIDNDVAYTDITVGFDTVLETDSEAIRKTRDTASSHHRAIIVEVMGRYAGWIALYSGVASGADVILIPEIPYELGKICEVVKRRSKKGRRYSIIVVAEGATEKGGKMVVEKTIPTSTDPIRLGGISDVLCDRISKATGIQCRAVRLGQIQRGGTPTHNDILLATQMGCAAVELLMKGYKNKLVVVRDGKISRVLISSVANKTRKIPVDHHLIRCAVDVGTSFGV